MAGSVVMAFEMVCPDRIDLIHKNYRKLCTLLVDVDEWGQVIILNVLTRYARSQFINPNREVRTAVKEIIVLKGPSKMCHAMNDFQYQDIVMGNEYSL